MTRGDNVNTRIDIVCHYAAYNYLKCKNISIWLLLLSNLCTMDVNKYLPHLVCCSMLVMSERLCNYINEDELLHTVYSRYVAVCFYQNHSQKTTIARPLRRYMIVFREFLVWPKVYLRIVCAVYSITLYRTEIYRESIVLHNIKLFWFTLWQISFHHMKNKL